MRDREVTFWFSLCVLLNILTYIILYSFIDLNDEYFLAKACAIAACLHVVYILQSWIYRFKQSHPLSKYVLKCVVGHFYELMHYFVLSSIPWTIYVLCVHHCVAISQFNYHNLTIERFEPNTFLIRSILIRTFTRLRLYDEDCTT